MYLHVASYVENKVGVFVFKLYYFSTRRFLESSSMNKIYAADA